MINGVECETVTGQPWFDTNQIMTCDIRDGLNCDNSINFGDMCKDYRIRYQCQVICKGRKIILLSHMILLILTFIFVICFNRNHLIAILV